MSCSLIAGMAFTDLESYFHFITFSLLLKIGRLAEDKQKLISFTMNIYFSCSWKKTTSDYILLFKIRMHILNRQIYLYVDLWDIFNQLWMDLKLCFILGYSLEKHTFLNKPDAEFPRGVKRLCAFTDFCGFFLPIFSSRQVTLAFSVQTFWMIIIRVPCLDNRCLLVPKHLFQKALLCFPLISWPW